MNESDAPEPEKRPRGKRGGKPRLICRLDADLMEHVNKQPEGVSAYLTRLVRKDKLQGLLARSINDMTLDELSELHKLSAEFNVQFATLT